MIIVVFLNFRQQHGEKVGRRPCGGRRAAAPNLCVTDMMRAWTQMVRTESWTDMHSLGEADGRGREEFKLPWFLAWEAKWM